MNLLYLFWSEPGCFTCHSWLKLFFLRISRLLFPPTGVVLVFLVLFCSMVTIHVTGEFLCTSCCIEIRVHTWRFILPPIFGSFLLRRTVSVRWWVDVCWICWHSYPFRFPISCIRNFNFHIRFRTVHFLWWRCVDFIFFTVRHLVVLFLCLKQCFWARRMVIIFIFYTTFKSVVKLSTNTFRVFWPLERFSISLAPKWKSFFFVVVENAENIWVGE